MTASSNRAVAAPHRDRLLIVVGLALALGLRVLIVALTHNSYHPISDAGDFYRIAVSISHGRGFGGSTFDGASGHGAFRAPLWPGLLGGLFALFHPSVTLGRLFLALVGTALVAMTAVLAGELAGRRVAFTVLFLGAIYPPLMLGGYGLNYEPLIGLFVVSSLYFGRRWTREGASNWWLAGAGVLAGAAVLCREPAAVVILCLWALVVQKRKGGHLLRNLILVTACLVLTVAPWTIRNAVQLHAFVPVSDGAGPGLAIEYNPYSATHISSPALFSPKGLPPLRRGETELAFTRAAQHRAVTYIEHHPANEPKFIFWNVVHLGDLQGPHSATWIDPAIRWPDRFVEISTVAFYIVGLLGLGVAFTRRRRQLSLPVVAFPALWMLTIALSVSINQYRFAMEPFFVLFAAMTLVSAFERVRPPPP